MFFILAFSLISKASYENVSKKHYAPAVPIVLVGKKLDLRDDKQFSLIIQARYLLLQPSELCFRISYVSFTSHLLLHGEELRKMIVAIVYIECSSKTQQNVKAVFDAAIKVVLQPPKQKKWKRKAQKACQYRDKLCGVRILCMGDVNNRIFLLMLLIFISKASWSYTILLFGSRSH